MITELSVENLAIIDRAGIHLEPGFTVFTGETGAGKSLLVDAMELALGGRADSDQVRSGAERSVIQMSADLSQLPAVRQSAETLGIDLPASGQLSVVREVYAGGRSTCRIAGKAFPAAVLRQLGRLLVDLHGQHDHQQLLHPELHAGTLDSWIGEPAESAKAVIADAWTRLTAVRRRLDALRSGRREWERQIDSLRHQIEEIEAAGPELGEFEQTSALIAKLKHAERLAEASAHALDLLADSESPALDGLGAAVKLIGDAERFDEQLQEVNAPFREALAALQEGVHQLRAYADELDSDPARLEEAAARLDLLGRLRRKYGDDEAAVLAHLEDCRSRLADLTNFDGDETSLAAACDELEQAHASACAGLTNIRTERAAAFAAGVVNGLRDLAMDSARFEVDIEPAEPGPDGADRIEFLFSANKGEPVRPLAKIASGGELSRTMLAIKTALAGSAGVPTLIFDEVDAGLSGQAAAAVAKKLEELGGRCQVIVISHLPQIAARARRHFKIMKSVKAGRTVTEVVPLEQAEREREIARLIAGETITETSLAHARELLGS